MGISVAYVSALSLITFACVVNARKPHILLVVADDLGWADVGYHHKKEQNREIQTPTIDQLVASGIELNRHYVHCMCTPSRAALQSGRLPVHVLQSLAGPCDVNGAIPRNMTGLGELMKRGNYRTVFAGKWDAGMATFDHTPKGRGYDEALHYFHHMNDYWRQFYVGNSGISGGDNSRAVRCAPNTGERAPQNCFR